MSEYHPEWEDLDRFARGDVFALERRRIEAHLRSGCRSCQRMVDQMLPGASTDVCLEGVEDELDWQESSQLLDRTFAKLERRLAQINHERNIAPGLATELTDSSPGQRLMRVRNDLRYQTLAVCDNLVERSLEVGFHDPAQSVELAELAIEVANRLDGSRYGLSVVQDVKARAWAYLGNARRINSDLVGAEQALLLAELLIEEGSADPLEEARILDLKASLLSDQGWFEQAADLLDIVIEIYEDVKEPHRKGRATISKGVFLGYAGRPEKAVELLLEGLSLIDGERDPRLVLMARNNFVWFLNDSGQCEEALQQLDRFRHSYQAFPDSWTELRLAWLEGRIAIGLGQFEGAEIALREVQRRFVEQGLGYDASMVTLDLADLYLRQGRGEEVRDLATAMFPIFVAQDVHRQALAALAVFQQAAEMDAATIGLVEEIASYLQRARKNPKLIFHQSSMLRSDWK